ncbi:MAG: hypothetical protein JW808_02170 [Victivallales bacterium]|nr:hypothetical protein [Victivallales bacterium]
MIKKILILLLVAAIVAVATIPIWTHRMAESAFENPGRQSTEKIKQALLVKMRLHDHKGGRILAEKAVLYFPESSQLDYFVYNAAICGEQEGMYDVAIFWYDHFLARFPDHEWASQAKNKLNILKGLHKQE